MLKDPNAIFDGMMAFYLILAIVGLSFAIIIHANTRRGSAAPTGQGNKFDR